MSDLFKDSDPRAVAALNIAMDRIVNPICDDCGKSVQPPHPHPGPHQCWDCQQLFEQIGRASYQDFVSQERPRGRRVHVVKLPEGMR